MYKKLFQIGEGAVSGLLGIGTSVLSGVVVAILSIFVEGKSRNEGLIVGKS